MAFEIVQDPELEFNERLRMERGWGEVAKGLSQVLIGYGVLFLGTVIGVGLVVIAVFGFQETLFKGGKPSNAMWWEFYLGCGILSVIGLISFGIIVGGQFRCMLHAAERHGARWFMFLCIACLFLGPMFHFASGIASRQAFSELKAHPDRMRDFQLSPLAKRLTLLGFAIGTLYPLCFLLFLRAIATCLRATVHVVLISIFLVFAASLVAATMYALYKHPLGGPPMPPLEALLLIASWAVVLLLYVGLIGMMRVCIQSVMARVRSPLEM